MGKDIEFTTEDGVILRGWHYVSEGRQGKAPTIVMAHGFSAVKEMYLDRFADALCERRKLLGGFEVAVGVMRVFGRLLYAPDDDWLGGTFHQHPPECVQQLTMVHGLREPRRSAQLGRS